MEILKILIPENPFRQISPTLAWQNVKILIQTNFTNIGMENPFHPENPENPDSDKFHQHWHGKR